MTAPRPRDDARPLVAPGAHGIAQPMRDLAREEVDVCIVGAGASGSVLAAHLAEAGLSVVLLEAGPHWDPSSELDVECERDGGQPHARLWPHERVAGGQDPIAFGPGTAAWGVGGGTVGAPLLALRAPVDDFRRRTVVGDVAGAELRDWPLTYFDLEPYYRRIERELPVAGPLRYPWPPTWRRYPQREHPLNAAARAFVRGATALGLPVAPAPTAVLSAPHEDRLPCRPHAAALGGCPALAVGSALVTFIPRAIRAGAEVRADATALRVETDERGTAVGVLWARAGAHERHLQRARLVVLAASGVETPRLLLASDTPRFPYGLANDSGLVGRCFMVHLSHELYAAFDGWHDPQRALPPGSAVSERFAAPSAAEGHPGGFTMHAARAPLGEVAARIAASRGLWGPELRAVADGYGHRLGVGITGELLPQRRNRVELHPDARDAFGQPLACVSLTLHDADRHLARHACEWMERILAAAGGRDAWSAPGTAHLLGGCRMGADRADAVVDADCRAHDVPNLFVCDGSVFPTALAVPPWLTAQALAARTAERIVALGRGRSLAA